MLLTDILKKRALETPDNLALSMKMGYRTESFTYSEVLAFAKRICVLLEEMDIGKGDPVVLLAPNTPYLVALIWAVWLRGAVIVPLNVQSTPDIVASVIEKTEAKAVFTHLQFHHLLPEGMTIRNIEFLEEETMHCSTAGLEDCPLQEDDLAQIMFTSGTTGDPKGVMLTHKNMLTTANAICAQVSITAHDRVLSILPLTHVYEQVVGFLAPYKEGAHIIYTHRPSALVALMQEYQITKMIAVSEFLSLLMRKLEYAVEEQGKTESFKKARHFAADKPLWLRRLLFRKIHQKLGGSLSVVASGGAPLDPELEKKWEALGIHILQGYGLTEVAGVATMNTIENQKTGSAGRAIPDVELTIADDGEILLGGPSVFQGYYKNDEATEKVFSGDHIFHTGDIGDVDEDGHLFIKGRKKYMILSASGQNVYPEDIENALNQQDEVVDSCVIGVKTSEGHVDIHAVLLFEEKGPDAEKIVTTANEGLANYQAITKWSIWPEHDFPRTSSRKIKREEVRKWVSAQGEGESDDTGKAKVTKLQMLLASVTGVSMNSIAEDTILVRDLHLDSLTRVELVTRIEDEYRVAIDESDITDTTTVLDLEKMVEEGKPAGPAREMPYWLISPLAQVLRIFVQPVFLFLCSLFLRVQVDGVEHVRDLKGPVLFMPNHKCVADSVAVTLALPYALRRSVASAAAEDIELFDGYGWRGTLSQFALNAFPLPRKSMGDISFGLEQMGWFLDRGYSVMVFPEGEANGNDTILPFKRGAGLMATVMDVQVVPVFIEGTQKAVRPLKFEIIGFWETVHVRFGAPMKFSKKDPVDRVTEDIRDAVVELRRKHKIDHKWEAQIEEAFDKS